MNVSVMGAAAQRFVGSHDFRWFATGLPPGKSTVRRVYRWEVWREEDTVIIESEANGFLRHQIRRANALLIEIGKGRRPESAVTDALDGNLPGGWECPPVPARGLCLMKVTYPFFSPLAGVGGQARSAATRGEE